MPCNPPSPAFGTPLAMSTHGTGLPHGGCAADLFLATSHSIAHCRRTSQDICLSPSCIRRSGPKEILPCPGASGQRLGRRRMRLPRSYCNLQPVNGAYKTLVVLNVCLGHVRCDQLPPRSRIEVAGWILVMQQISIKVWTKECRDSVLRRVGNKLCEKCRQDVNCALARIGLAVTASFHEVMPARRMSQSNWQHCVLKRMNSGWANL